MKSAPRILAGSPEGKVLVVGLRHRGERNIKMDLKCIISGTLHRCGPVYGPCRERENTSAFTNCGNSLAK